MAHSRKDGRRSGGHVDTQNREVWSRRCRLVTGWTYGSNKHAPRGGPGWKTITHRYERRMAQRQIAAELIDLWGAPSPEPGNG